MSRLGAVQCGTVQVPLFFARVVAAVIGFLVIGCSGSTGPKQPAAPAAVLSIDTSTAIPGTSVSVNLRLVHPDGDGPRLDSLGGFEFLICYDKSALTLLQPVTAGPAISNWEYFTYRTLPSGPCPPCGLRALSILASRDLDNGVAPEPPQYTPEGILVRMYFDVSTDLSLRGTIAHVGFCLHGCRSNTISAIRDSETLYTPDTTLGQILYADGYDPSKCPYPPVRSPVLELRGGWVRIAWPPLIQRGDINLDGNPFDLFDFILFARFFFEGYSVWNPDMASRQIAASDCNGDGEPLTVADLDFLVRVLYWGIRLSDTLPDPYADTILVAPRLTGDHWIIATRSSSPVSTLWLQLEDSSGADYTVRWLGDSAARAGAHQSGGTLRILVNHWSSKQVFGPEWGDRLEITTPSPGSLNIVAAQASRYPGVSMTVRVVRPINGADQMVTVSGEAR